MSLQSEVNILSASTQRRDKERWGGVEWGRGGRGGGREGGRKGDSGRKNHSIHFLISSQTCLGAEAAPETKQQPPQVAPSSAPLVRSVSNPALVNSTCSFGGSHLNDARLSSGVGTRVPDWDCVWEGTKFVAIRSGSDVSCWVF